jgi:hypothetical protein
MKGRPGIEAWRSPKLLQEGGLSVVPVLGHYGGVWSRRLVLK